MTKFSVYELLCYTTYEPYGNQIKYNIQNSSTTINLTVSRIEFLTTNMKANLLEYYNLNKNRLGTLLI